MLFGFHPKESANQDLKFVRKVVVWHNLRGSFISRMPHEIDPCLVRLKATFIINKSVAGILRIWAVEV